MRAAGGTCHGRRAAARGTRRQPTDPTPAAVVRGAATVGPGAVSTGPMRAAPLAERGEPSTMAAMSWGVRPARSAAAAIRTRPTFP